MVEEELRVEESVLTRTVGGVQGRENGGNQNNSEEDLKHRFTMVNDPCPQHTLCLEILDNGSMMFQNVENPG